MVISFRDANGLFHPSRKVEREAACQWARSGSRDWTQEKSCE